ncbi:hypothetical protein DFH28DRAFT_978248 [Melampsora americana]|nr:hypothetical protein DFH28DRAFT_978248 [Melampsora americana]
MMCLIQNIFYNLISRTSSSSSPSSSSVHLIPSHLHPLELVTYLSMDEPFQSVFNSNPSAESPSVSEGSSSNRNPSPHRSPSPSAPRNAQVIDLTQDPDHTPTSSRYRPSNQAQTSSHVNLTDSDDEILFTGQNQVSTSSHRPASRPHRSRVPSNEQNVTEPPRARSSFMENVANLTAGIHAGLFSFHPTPAPNSPPAQGPSTIIIRDSPPLQVRRNPTSNATFGGGGILSGGFFSGIATSGIHHFREWARSTGLQSEPNDAIEGLFLNLTGPNRRNPSNARGDPARLFAWFDLRASQANPTASSSYVELDSHPLRIKSGFSKNIIPLDREFLTLDSDSQTINPTKQDSKPVCASCDQPLLLGQGSCTHAGGEGRRPWILACGHVVDSTCLEAARRRVRNARSLKTESARAKRAALALARGRGRGRGRSKRPLSSLQHRDTSTDDQSLNPTDPSALESPTAATSKRVRLESLTPRKTSNGQSSSSLHVDRSSTRAHRAAAREARRSMDSTSTSPQITNLALQNDKEESALEEISKSNKGKAKAKDPLEEPHQADAVLPLSLTWLECPVKSCTGPRGNVLAPKGTKKAPWEIFV